MKKLFIFLLSIISLSIYGQDIAVNIEIETLRSSKGKIHIMVYKDQLSFDNEKPAFMKSFSKGSNVKNGIFASELLLPEGIYALALLDDENDNGKMDSNFIGMPKEGFGFSNFIFEKLKKPTFDDFKVIFNNETETIKFKVKYM